MDKLFPTTPQQYGEKYTEHRFDQYKMFVDSAEKNSDRRLDAHKYFASVNAAILTAVGLTLQFGNYESRMWARLVLAIAGIGAAGVYWLLIRAYKSLNSAKFKVIQKVEEQLPLALYSAEWDQLDHGKDWWKHLPFSRIEIWIPIAFALGYGLLLFWCLKWFVR